MPQEQYAIIAHPVQHTLTPHMYDAAFKTVGIDGYVNRIDVTNEQLGSFLHTIKNGNPLGLRGLIVSLPLKQEAVPFVDEMDPIAKEMGAINTIKIQDGKLIGYNTDWIGVMQSMEEKMAAPHSRLQSLKWKNVLVVGGRGVACAAIYAFKKLGARVFVMNRTEERAIRLAEQFQIDYLPYDFSAITQTFDVVFNGTILGMDCYTSSVPIQFWEMAGNGIAFDAVYRHETTRFLSEAERAGWDTIHGKAMLTRQAVDQFRILTGHAVDLAVFEAAIEEKIHLYQTSQQKPKLDIKSK